MTQNREFDLVLWGASGFTGKLVTEYINNTYKVEGDLSWAIAGRNLTKLEQVKTELGISNVPVIIADSNDRQSLDAMCRRTKVVCTTVGPYAKYGTKLVAACIENQTDYCDLTGEVQWMRKIIDTFHEKAQSQGVRIVHTCGFDSVPSDMGVYFMQEKMKEKFGSYSKHIKLRVKAARGGMSGGTVASLNYIMEQAASDSSIYKTLSNPYGLNPKDQMEGSDVPDISKVVYDNEIDSWLAPFIMAMINTKVVRRSHALKSFPYGKDFKYDEAMMTGKGIGGKVKAGMITGILGLIMGGKPGKGHRKLVDKFLPDPGEGPSKRKRESGFFNIAIYALADDGLWVKGKVTGDMDPGYGSTSKMLGEAAVCLAKDKELCPDVSGILTPSVALSESYLKRLQTNAGLKFSIE